MHPIQQLQQDTVALRGGARMALLAAFLVLLLVAALGANPYAAHASVLQLHGALNRPEGVGIISHRGAAAIAPENTLAALDISLDRGVDFVEVDLRLTSDGVPVLMHDETVDRTTNGSGYLSRFTLAEVQALDAGGWFSADFAGERVPTLEEFLDVLAPTTSRALIELKGEWSDDRISEAVSLLTSRYLVDRVAFESFEVSNLERLERLAPAFARVMLTRSWDEATLDLAVELQASAIGAREKLFAKRPDLIETAQRLGIGTMVYTLNSKKKWKRATTHGVDLIITDNPLALEEWRDGTV